MGQWKYLRIGSLRNRSDIINIRWIGSGNLSGVFCFRIKKLRKFIEFRTKL